MLARFFFLESFVEVRQVGVRGLHLAQRARVDFGDLQRILVEYAPSHVLHDAVQVFLFHRLLSSLNLIHKDREANVVHIEGGAQPYFKPADSFAQSGAELSPKYFRLTSRRIDWKAFGLEVPSVRVRLRFERAYSKIVRVSELMDLPIMSPAE